MNSTIVAVLLTVYRRRKFIILVTVAAFLLGAAKYLVLSSSTYEAETLLLVTSREMAGENEMQLAPSPLNPKIYAEILTSHEVLQKVLETLSASKPAAELPDLETFSSMVEAKISVVDQTTRPIQYSPLLTVTVRADSPDIARTILDTWIRVGIDVSRQAVLRQVGQFASSLETLGQLRIQDLEKIRKAREEEMAKLDTETVEEELKQLSALTVRLLETRNLAEQRLTGAQATLKTVQASLAQEKPVIELLKAPDDTAVWLLSNEDVEKGKESPLREKGMVTQQRNQIYLALKEDEQSALNEEASSQAQIASIDLQISTLRTRIETLQKQLSTHVIAIQSLQTDEKVASEAYETVASGRARYADAARLIGEAGDDKTLAVGVNRLLNTSPVVELGTTKKKLMVAAFTILAFGFSVAYVILQEHRNALWGYLAGGSIVNIGRNT